MGEGSERRIYTALKAKSYAIQGSMQQQQAHQHQHPFSEVVVKVITLPRDPIDKNEAVLQHKRLMDLSSPNVVNVIDVQIRENSCYIVMVYINILNNTI